MCLPLECSATDALSQLLMKGAVNCDNQSDLQISADRWNVECGQCLQVAPGSTAAALLGQGVVAMPRLFAFQIKVWQAFAIYRDHTLIIHASVVCFPFMVLVCKGCTTCMM